MNSEDKSTGARNSSVLHAEATSVLEGPKSDNRIPDPVQAWINRGVAGLRRIETDAVYRAQRANLVF